MSDEAEILDFLKARKAAKRVAVLTEEIKPSPIVVAIKEKTGLKKVKPGWLQKSIADANKKASEPTRNRATDITAIKAKFRQANAQYDIGDYIDLKDILVDYKHRGYEYAMQLIEDVIHENCDEEPNSRNPNGYSDSDDFHEYLDDAMDEYPSLFDNVEVDDLWDIFEDSGLMAAKEYVARLIKRYKAYDT